MWLVSLHMFNSLRRVGLRPGAPAWEMLSTRRPPADNKPVAPDKRHTQKALRPQMQWRLEF
jgi:hypothetical protein